MTSSTERPRVAVIMAGGAGERFWPYSRRQRPKQLLRFGDGLPMLVQTLDRIASLIPRERVLIVAGETLCAPILEVLGPEFPAGNIVTEPMPKNTAACLALAAVEMEKRFGPNATMAVLTADHAIEPDDAFLEQLALACRVAETTGDLVTFGIPPTRPETGFGYIEVGEELPKLGPGVRRVVQFREKPNLEMAREFLEAGNFLWNSGMFCWTGAALTEAFERHRPAFFRGMGALADVWGSSRYPEVMRQVFDKWESLSIDIAIMEKAMNRVTIEARFAWNDIGSWTSLEHLRAPDSDGNIVLTDAVALDSQDNILFWVPDDAKARRPLVATLGVRDLIVVVADDVVMICDRNRPQDVKKLLAKVRETGREDLV